MIRVTIELLPYGVESQKRHLGTALIANDGTGTATVGNYKYTLSKRGQPQTAWKSGRVQGFKRRMLGAYDLILLVLAHACADRLLSSKKENHR